MKAEPDFLFYPQAKPTTDGSRDIAVPLREHAEQDVRDGILRGQPTVRPSNRASDRARYWYMSPRSDDPAYHLGKFIVSHTCPIADMLVGIWFEKGVGRSAAGMFTKGGKNLRRVMDERKWIWPSFFEALSDDSFCTDLDGLQSKAGIRPTIKISIGPVLTGRDEADAPIASDQELYYQYDSGHIGLMHAQEHERILGSPEGVSSLDELASAIGSLDRLDWLWISAEFGALLNRPEVDGSTMSSIDSSELWNSVCVPLVGWFR